MFGTADDETIRGLRAQLIGPCHESGLQNGWLKPAFHLPVTVQACFGKRRQQWKTQQGCVSLCTHIIDTQRWQTNYSFRLSISTFCILFANSPLSPSCVLGKHKMKWVHQLCFWLSPAVHLPPLFWFRCFQIGFLTPLPSLPSYFFESFEAAFRAVVGVPGLCYLTCVQPYLLWNIPRVHKATCLIPSLRGQWHLLHCMHGRSCICEALSFPGGWGEYRSEYDLAIKDLRTDWVDKRMTGYFGVTWTVRELKKAAKPGRDVRGR